MQEAILRIHTYFKMWEQRDFSRIEEVFAKEVFYRECTGSVFYGMDQIHQWVAYMLEHQWVNQWRIDEIISGEKQMYTVRWYFEASDKSQSYHFDGVSIIRFNDQQRIISVEEYEAKSEQITPAFIK